MNKVKAPNVLIADDFKIIRMGIRKILAALQYPVIGEATNGQEAVDLYKKLKPDLLLLDVNMPVKNGDQALAEIMAHDPDAFVIILTSISDVNTVRKLVDLGAANYIRKDVPGNEILKMIQQTWETA